MADGSIKIKIEVDGKEINVASKELDKLEDAGSKSGKGIKAAESAVDSLADKSAKAGTSVKGASDAVDNLGDSSSKTGKDLKGAESAVSSLADSSGQAGKSVKGASDSIDGLADSGARAGKDLKGADSAIDSLSDSSSNASKGLKGTSDSLDGVSDSASNAAKSAKDVNDETEQMGGKSQKATVGFKSLATSLGLVAVASSAFNVLKDSMDSAISRFDTLNKFPKILGEMGVSAEDADKAMDKLSDGIDGLPTTLDDISASALEMYGSFQDMDTATDTAIALNNALLGSGASAEQAKRGTQQYNKSLQTGKIDMMTWNTLTETMGIGLIKIAEGFGFAGKSAKNDLYNALQDGSITLDQFNDELIKVGTGTGIMAKLAKENSLGIETSLTNLKNAAAKGIANIIDSFNDLSIAVTGKDIAQNIDSLKVAVNASFSFMQKSIEATTPVFKLFGSVVSATLPILKELTPVIIGAGTAYAGLMIVQKVGNVIKASNAILATARASQTALTIATKAQIAAEMTSASVKKADAVATVAQTGAIKLSTIAIGLMTGKLKLAEVATIALAAAKKLLGGPIGWVTAGLGALAGATVAVVKWFNKETEESKKLRAETSELANATNELSNSVKSNAQAYEESQNDIQASAQANQDLAKEIAELSEEENKSAAQKQILKDKIEQLNGEVDGLNLAYNEEADALSMSSEELAKKIDLTAEQTSYTEALERQLEISKEEIEVGKQLEEITAQREENNKAIEEGTTSKGKLKEETKELDEAEAELKATQEKLKEESEQVANVIEQGAEKMAQATENGVLVTKEALDEWMAKNEDLVNSMTDTYNEILDITTNAFDKMSEESKASADEMIENLQHNQEMTKEWGENISELYEYASKNGHEGFLHWLEQLGPDSAAEIAEISNMSDSQLKEFAELMDSGADVATDSFKTSLGDGMEDAFNAMEDVITQTPATLRESIKNADFESIGIDMTDGLSGGIKKGEKDVGDSAKDVAKKAEDEARKQSETHSPSRVFERIGGDLTSGLVLGINKGQSKVIQAINKMFNQVQANSTKSFKGITKGYDTAVKQIEMTLSKLPQVTQKQMQNTQTRLKTGSTAQINVMKTLTKQYDNSIKNIDKSLAKLPKIAIKAMQNTLTRIRTGGNQQINALRRTASMMPKQFNGLPNQMNSIGLNAMAGLNRGLNAGSGRVMSTARSIANRVASTMQKALKIHSPSRVMEADVGRWIPEGVARGVEKYSKVVDTAMQNLSNRMIISTPEQALGTNRMAYNGEAGHTINNIYRTTTNVNGQSNQPVKIEAGDVIIDGRKVGKVIWRRVKENIDQHESNIKAFGGGVN